MGDLLERGSRWLEAQRTRFCTREVMYVRGGLSVVVKATIGRTEVAEDDTEAVRVRRTERDYLVLAAELVLAGRVTLPERGDVVREVRDDMTLLFEVRDWRYSDPYQQTLRIHTQQIGHE